jgi:hypothetical protein
MLAKHTQEMRAQRLCTQTDVWPKVIFAEVWREPKLIDSGICDIKVVSKWRVGLFN